MARYSNMKSDMVMCESHPFKGFGTAFPALIQPSAVTLAQVAEETEAVRKSTQKVSTAEPGKLRKVKL